MSLSWSIAQLEGRTAKNWCLRHVLEKTPISPLDSKIKPVNLKGAQPWIFTKRTDAEVEAPVFWSSNAKRRLIEKVPGKDRGKKKRVSEHEMAGQHHWHNERELGKTPGDGEGKEGLVYCSPRGPKESDMTGRLKNIIGHLNILADFLPIWSINISYWQWSVEVFKSSISVLLVFAVCILMLVGREQIGQDSMFRLSCPTFCE